jgi:hypothetical protein
MRRLPIDAALARALGARIAAVLVIQLAAIAAYFSVISMYLKLPFGSGAFPFVSAQWWHLGLGDAIFVVAAIARRSARGALAHALGAGLPFAGLAFGAWAGTDPPVGRVLVAVVILAPTLFFGAWALPPASPSAADAS